MAGQGYGGSANQMGDVLLWAYKTRREHKDLLDRDKQRDAELQNIRTVAASMKSATDRIIILEQRVKALIDDDSERARDTIVDERLVRYERDLENLARLPAKIMTLQKGLDELYDKEELKAELLRTEGDLDGLARKFMDMLRRQDALERSNTELQQSNGELRDRVARLEAANKDNRTVSPDTATQASQPPTASQRKTHVDQAPPSTHKKAGSSKCRPRKVPPRKEATQPSRNAFSQDRVPQPAMEAEGHETAGTGPRRSSRVAKRTADMKKEDSLVTFSGSRPCRKRKWTKTEDSESELKPTGQAKKSSRGPARRRQLIVRLKAPWLLQHQSSPDPTPASKPIPRKSGRITQKTKWR